MTSSVTALSSTTTTIEPTTTSVGFPTPPGLHAGGHDVLISEKGKDNFFLTVLLVLNVVSGTDNLRAETNIKPAVLLITNTH